MLSNWLTTFVRRNPRQAFFFFKKVYLASRNLPSRKLSLNTKSLNICGEFENTKSSLNKCFC